MTVDSFIAHYGYLAILLGVFIEGELVVMTAGFFAHRQILQLEWVIAAALVGSVLTYQFFFLLGRLQGTRFLQRKPHWQARVAKIQHLLERHHTWVTFGYRALFGLRAMTPFALGMTRISQRRFLALDFIPALAWAVVFPCLGYVLGRELEPVLNHIQQYEGWAALAAATVLSVAVVITVAAHRARRR